MHPRSRTLNASQQSAALLWVHPQFRLIRRGSRFVWRGRLQATPLGAVYAVEIRLDLNSSPKVFVLDPPLQERNEKHIPHRFRDGSLCLYFWGEWSRQDPIAHTTVPWTVTWLYYYELWHATGEWLGGGVHPEPTTTNEDPHDHTF